MSLANKSWFQVLALTGLFRIPLLLLSICTTKFLADKKHLPYELLQGEDVKSSNELEPPYSLALEFFSVTFGSNTFIILMG